MSVSRLSLALDGALLSLPSEGWLGCFNAPADLDAHELGFDRVRATQSFYPEMAALRSRGVHVGPEPEPDTKLAAAMVVCHRARARSYDLLAQAFDLTQAGGLITIEGAKTDGIEAIIKALRKRLDGVEVYAKAHGKLAWVQRPETLPDLSDWRAAPKHVDGYRTVPGIFSSDGIDKGSALLAKHLPALSGEVLDLGAGWGYLSSRVLAQPKVSHMDLVDADYHAVQAAKANISDPRAEIHWADALKWTGRSYDAVVMNPPFHVTRKADTELGASFIRTAARLLKPRGDLWMVANRNLPYEKTLADVFAETQTVTQLDGFKVIHARKPKQTGASRR